MIEFYNTKALSSDILASTASQVMTLTHKSEAMVPLSEREFHESTVAFAAFSKDIFAGFIRVKPPVPHSNSGYDYQELSSLVVAPPFQGQGVARTLIGLALEGVLENTHIPCCFANQYSQPTFEKAGFEPALPAELPMASKIGNVALVYPGYKIWDMSN